MDLILLLFARMASTPKVTALAVNMVMAMTSDTGTPDSTTPAVTAAAAGITAATIRNARIFNLYIVVLIATALILAFLTWLVWDAGNRVQDAIRADAEAKLEVEKGKVAGLQRDATDAKTAAATAERSLLELQEKFRPRHLTPEQKATIKKSIIEHSTGSASFTIKATVAANDARGYADEIAALFNRAPINWHVNVDNAIVSGADTSGVWMTIKSASDVPPATGLLHKAFVDAGFPIRNDVQVDPGVPSPTEIWLTIGTKK